MTSKRSKARTWLIVLASGLFSLLIFFVAFSRPPLEQSSGAHYLAVGIFYLSMVGIWFLLSLGAQMLAGRAKLTAESLPHLLTGPVRASLAFSLALLLALFGWGTETEIGFAFAALALLIGFCLSTAALASQWAGRFKLSPLISMLIAGLGGPIGLLLSAWLTYAIFGGDFLFYDAMMFL